MRLPSKGPLLLRIFVEKRAPRLSLVLRYASARVCLPGVTCSAGYDVVFRSWELLMYAKEKAVG